MVVLLLVSSFSSAAASCRQEPAIAIGAAIASVRFVAYQPTGIAIVDGRATHANEASIAADLTVLRGRFDGLITYGALHGAERVPDVAARLGFKAVILGVWDVANQKEIDNAIAAWTRHRQLVVGASLGNEVLFEKRGDVEALRRAIETVRAKAPGLALSTTEPFHVFLTDEARPLFVDADFLLANVHPVFQPWFADASADTAAQFVVNVVDLLAGRYCGPILVKETGVPTAPKKAGYSEPRQAEFYTRLRELFAPTPARAFAYFSAFDAPWRVADARTLHGDHPEEAHWGLYDAARRPKAVVATVPELNKP